MIAMRRHISNEKNSLLQICNTLFLLPPTEGYGIMSPAYPPPPMTNLRPLLLLAALAAHASAWSDDAGLFRCRAITDSSARLACYDGLPLAAPVSQGPGAPAPSSARDRLPTGSAAAPAPPAEGQFGLAPKPSEEV